MRFPVACAAFQNLPADPGTVVPPATPLYDPNWQSVVSLVRFQGTDGQARLDDDTGRGWVRNGDAQIDTAVFFSGVSSGLFDGVGDFYNTLNNGDFDFGAGDFTIEFVLRPVAGTAGIHTLATTRTIGTAKGWDLVTSDTGHAGTYTFSFISWTSAGVIVHNVVGTATIADGSFSVVSVSRIGNTTYLHVNGVLDTSATVTGTLGVSGTDLCLARDNSNTARDYKGWIDSMRITKGLGRYSSNYTPAPFAPLPDTTIGTNVDNFDTNTIGNYTQTADIVSTWSISSGLMNGSGATSAQSLMLVNNQGAKDLSLSCVTSTANDLGLAARVLTNSTYYVVTLSDASGINPNTIRLFRRILGTFTQIGTNVSVSFTRGTSHKLTFTLSGSSLQVYFDDVLKINATDANITSSGKFGMRISGGTNTFDSFTYPIGTVFSYYRLKVPTVNGGTGFNVASLQLRSVNGGADVAVGGTAGATTQATGFEATKAFDSDATTMYKSTGPSPQWLTYTFSGTVDIQEIGIQAPPASYGSLAETCKNFTFEYSNDNLNWSVLISAVGQTAWSYGQIRSYNRSTGTYASDPGAPPVEVPPDPMTPYPTRTRGSAEISVLLHGAVGNGITDNVAAFNAAINALPSDGGTILVPAGTYLVDVSATKCINLRSLMQLKLSAGAKIVCKPNGLTRYYMLRAVVGVHDVEISGEDDTSQIIGDRSGHTGTTGEWGYGVRIEGATKITVRDLKISNCWGDGLIVGGSNSTYADDVWIWNVTSDNNRRQAITVGLAKNGHIEGCRLTNTNGTAPQAGIDFEPDTGPAYGWVVKNNVITGNAGAGILIWQHTSHDIVLNGNTVKNNNWGIYGDSVNNIEISSNICESNTHEGIRVDKNNTNWIITGNQLGKNSGGADRVPDVSVTGYQTTNSYKRDLLIYSSSTGISVLTQLYT